VPGEAASAIDQLSLEGMARHHLARGLVATGGNIANAARGLRINRTTLYQKIKKYGLSH
jgi:transcriptional regulator of acetoin/glycerol metabolism